jgi:hypothetical protein
VAAVAVLIQAVRACQVELVGAVQVEKVQLQIKAVCLEM